MSPLEEDEWGRKDLRDPLFGARERSHFLEAIKEDTSAVVLLKSPQRMMIDEANFRKIRSSSSSVLWMTSFLAWS